MKLISFAIVAIFLFLGVMIWVSCKHEDKLYQECLKDHKEYECFGIMRGHR